MFSNCAIQALPRFIKGESNGVIIREGTGVLFSDKTKRWYWVPIKIIGHALFWLAVSLIGVAWVLIKGKLLHVQWRDCEGTVWEFTPKSERIKLSRSDWIVMFNGSIREVKGGAV